MAGAVIEELDRAYARGIFATHLHGLLDLLEHKDLHVSPFVRTMKMETVRADGDDDGGRRGEGKWGREGRQICI